MKLFISLFCFALTILTAPVQSAAQCLPGAPQQTTNPSYDVVVTRLTPTLSFANAKGGSEPRTYQLQISTSPDFSQPVFFTVAEKSGGVSALPIPKEQALSDGRRYWWRVRAVDAKGNKGPWALSRFTVDTASDDAFMGLVRAAPLSVKVSSGADAKNLIDYSDQGLATQWRAAPPGNPRPWVELDLGEAKTISRIWMLASAASKDGWPVKFKWLASNDGQHWQSVPGSGAVNSDTYRFDLRIKATKARFWRLLVSKWRGYSLALNELLLMSPGHPPVPAVPAGPYVLVIGNQHNGFTFTELAERVSEMVPELKTVTVPHHQASLAMYRALEHPPVAILLSGNNADYNNLPMYEFNGEYEIIRAAPAPVLGICAGHQMLAFAYGYTRVRSMGWSDITAMDKPSDYTKIKLLRPDPLFEGLPNPFHAVEIHGWAVYEPGPGFEVVAASGYIQSQRAKGGRLHGVQFHPEIKASYNQPEQVLRLFLERALAASKKN